MNTDFLIPDMTCGHCVGVVTQAVKALDPAADVQVDLPHHRVKVVSSTADTAALREALVEVGYTPQVLAAG